MSARIKAAYAPPSRRNPVARTLRSQAFRPRVVPDKRRKLIAKADARQLTRGEH
jgi:hypothetical protein